jgi:stage II sporulation protein D
VRGVRLGGGLLLGASLAALACAPPPPAPSPEPALGGGEPIRIAIVGGASAVRLGGTGPWQLEGSGGHPAIARIDGRGEWRVEAGSSGLRAVAPGGASSGLHRSLVARPAVGDAFVTVEGRAYRGTVSIVATDTGVLVINRVPLEEYLLGVVPIEMGRRTEREREALAAQAVASRGFAMRRRSPSVGDGAYDLVATVLAQAYGGVLSEYDLATEAVRRTSGLVLRHDGRPIEAVYSSTCGGSTAAASEVWRSADLPYLRPVSDRIPGTEDWFCSPSPRFRWVRDFDAAALATTLRTHLPRSAGAAAGDFRAVREISVDSTTATGRVGTLTVRTDRGTWAVRGNEVRFVLRDANGGILPSTYFSLTTRRDAAGSVASLAVSGRGNGHGIGMCQWGAIGRARAGQDFRSILETYYPGTTVARVD